MKEESIRLEDCVKEFGEKLNFLAIYIKVTRPCLLHEGAVRLRRFQKEILVNSLYSYFEYFLKCTFYAAMIARPDLVKSYYAKRKINHPELNRILCDRQAYQKLWSYAEELASIGKLERVVDAFTHFFGFDLFKNEDILGIIKELGMVRRVLFHHAEIPNEKFAKDIKTQGVVVEPKVKRRRVYGRDVLDPINLTDEFIAKVLLAFKEIISHLKDNLMENCEKAMGKE